MANLTNDNVGGDADEDDIEADASLLLNKKDGTATCIGDLPKLIVFYLWYHTVSSQPQGDRRDVLICTSTENCFSSLVEEEPIQGWWRQRKVP